jgi:hypothetical protein
MTQLPAILALGLFTPAFAVAGALLIGVPILIHLLNRQRFKVVDWAAMEFLLRAMRKNRKRMKVEQWLLLATRCLVVLLVGLALARPWGGCEDSSLAGAVAGRAGVNVFVIDNSLSAGYVAPHATVKGMDGQPLPPAKTHLDQQKQMARVLIDTLSRGGESVAIITAARPATAITVRPGYNLAEAQTIVDRIEQSYAGTDMAGALQLANRMADEEAGKAPVRNLYLFSDGTRGAWANEQQAETLKRLGPEVAARYKVTHFNMSEGKQQWNLAAVDLRPTDNLVTTRFESGLSSTVRGYGTSPDASLQLYVDDRKLGTEKTLRPDPTSPPTAERLLPDQVKVGGPHLFTAAVNADRAGDPLKVDDRRYRVVDVAAEVKVLIVEGQVSERYNESSGSFLKSALAPAAEDSGVLTAGPRSKTHVTAQLGSEVDLKDRPLREYRAVVLAGVERLDEKAADNLAAFVRDGGALLTFVSEKVQAENYNTVLLTRGLIPGRLLSKDDRRGTSTGYVFDFNPKAQVVDRYLESFKLQQNTGLDTARINTFWKVDVSGNPAVERILNYTPAPIDPTDKREAAGTAAAAAKPLDTSKPPGVTAHPLGQGVVVFVSTTASPAVDRGWHELIPRGTWVQLVHELLGGAVSAKDGWMNLQAGQPLVIPSYVETTTPKLLDENKTLIAVDATADAGPSGPSAAADQPGTAGQPAAAGRSGHGGKSTVYRSRPLTKPGVYSLELRPNVTVPVAVNVAADDADVRTVGNEGVRQALGGIAMTGLGDELPIEAIVAAKDGYDWAGQILLILLALLGVECVMAMWFGRTRSTGAVRGPVPAGT